MRRAPRSRRPALPPFPNPADYLVRTDRRKECSQGIHAGGRLAASRGARPVQDGRIDRTAASAARQLLDDAPRLVGHHDVDSSRHVDLRPRPSPTCATHYTPMGSHPASRRAGSDDDDASASHVGVVSVATEARDGRERQDERSNDSTPHREARGRPVPRHERRCSRFGGRGPQRRRSDRNRPGARPQDRRVVHRARRPVAARTDPSPRARDRARRLGAGQRTVAHERGRFRG